MKLLALFLTIVHLAFPVYADLQKVVETHFRKSDIPQQDLGIVISSSSNEGLAQINAKTKMIPASVTKLFTAAAVLSHIAPGTKIKTQLRSEAKTEEGVLKGPLYLVGGGDPGFVSESLWFLVNAFTRNQIKKIEGDLIVDDSLFDAQRFDDSRQAARVDRAYDAPVGAMSFNWNSVNIFLRPGHKTGSPGQVFVDPENEYIVLENELKTSSKTDYSIDRIAYDDGRDKIRVKGRIAQDSKELVIFKSISRPDLWSAYNLKSFLAQRGISITGKIKTGKVPASARVLAESESKPIESMVADMNKFSNNYVAEMLTKLLATQKDKSGSLAAGVGLINDFALGQGIPTSQLELYNPSGLTRENSFSAQALHTLLEKVRKDFQIFPEFVASLPIAGVDGTLKNRFKGGSATRWVRAKTGLLTGVTSLAGYAGKENGEILSFVLLYNGNKDGAKVRKSFDSLLEILLK